MCSWDTAAGSVWKEDAKQSFPSLRSVHFADGEAHRLPLQSRVPACFESSLSAADRSLWQPAVVELGIISLFSWGGALAMVWLASSVWWRRRVAYCGLGPAGWGVSIMTRLPSPGWSFEMPSGSTRNCLQRKRPFRLSAAGAVIWRRLLVTPSFTARSYGRCASFLKATWSASSMERFCPRSQFCVQQWTLCVSLLTRRYACHDLDDEKEGVLREWVFFFSDLGGIF